MDVWVLLGQDNHVEKVFAGSDEIETFCKRNHYDLQFGLATAIIYNKGELLYRASAHKVHDM